MIAVVGTLSGALGMIIGSFLNVVSWRVPRGESIVSPPSACPGCGHEIRARDNVPLLSWLLLRGRCRDCNAAISAHYPLIEVLTGVAFVVVVLWSAPAILERRRPRRIRLCGGEPRCSPARRPARRLPLPRRSHGRAQRHRHRGAPAAQRDRAPRLRRRRRAADGGRAAPGRAAVAHRRGDRNGRLVRVLRDPRLRLPGGHGLRGCQARGRARDVPRLPRVAGARGRCGEPRSSSAPSRERHPARRVAAGGGTAIPFGPWMFAGAWIGIFAGEPLASGYLNLVGLA